MGKRFIIAIDGPAAAGKSTVGRTLADKLDYIYIDTGAIYRAIAWKAQKTGIDSKDEECLTKLIKSSKIDFRRIDHQLHIFVDNQDVNGEIRNEKIGEMASTISAFKSVRENLLDIQREMGKDGGIVMDGRDIGTVIFPNADYKFYLDASVEERGERRYLELKERGVEDDLTTVIENMKIRDRNDSQRKIAPLKKAEDAIYIDSTALAVEQVAERIIGEIKDDVSSSEGIFS